MPFKVMHPNRLLADPSLTTSNATALCSFFDTHSIAAVEQSLTTPIARGTLLWQTQVRRHPMQGEFAGAVG